jgi:hypothetical protein
MWGFSKKWEDISKNGETRTVLPNEVSLAKMAMRGEVSA